MFLALLVAIVALSWFLPQRFGGRGQVAFFLLILPAAIAALFAVQQHSPNPTHSVDQAIEFFTIVSAICLGVTLPVSLLARRRPKPAVWNPRLSVYWLWLVIVFGMIAALPGLPFSRKLASGNRYVPIATAYSRPDLFDGWQVILVGHTLVSLLVAVPAAAHHTLRRRQRGLSEPVSFDLRQLLGAAAMLALVFGLLAWYKAPPVVFVAAILLYSGCPATLILAGIIARREESGHEDAGNPGINES